MRKRKQTQVKTLRDEIAIKAMVALIAKAPFLDSAKKHDVIGQRIAIVRGAYAYADSMLAIRSNPNA